MFDSCHLDQLEGNSLEAVSSESEGNITVNTLPSSF